MSVASSPSTARRLLALLSLLQSRRDWSARVLAERLGVSERTVRRDVERLRELDYAVDATRGPDGGYRLEAGARMPPLLLDEDQAFAVRVALSTVAALGGELGDAAGRASQTVDRLMPSHVAHRVQRFAVESVPPSTAAPVDPAVLLEIGAAVRDQQTLRFDYASPGSREDDGGARPAARTTEPHHLLLHSGRWYLLGWSPERQDWRVHRADRMSLRSPHGRRFERHEVPGGDAARFLSARFKGSDGADTWPCWGELVLAAPVAALAPYVGDGTLQEHGPRASRLRLGSWSWDGLAARCLAFGVDVAEAEPAELRTALVRLADRARAAGAAPVPGREA